MRHVEAIGIGGDVLACDSDPGSGDFREKWNSQPQNQAQNPTSSRRGIQREDGDQSSQKQRPEESSEPLNSREIKSD